MNHSHRTTHKRRGFTIVELVIVIAVIGILATVLVPTFGDVIQNAKDSAAKQEAKNAYTEYMVGNAGNSDLSEYYLYKTNSGHFVMIQNGSPVDVYDSQEDALTALFDDPDTTENEARTTAVYQTIKNGLFLCQPNDPNIEDFAGKTIAFYGDSVTAATNGDYIAPYNSGNWATQVGNYFGFEKVYGRGIGGQTFCWGNGGGSVCFIEEATGKSYNKRNDSFTFDNYTGEIPAGNIKTRGAACSYHRICSMFPESIREDIDYVFVIFHNDFLQGASVLDQDDAQWETGNKIDPEWATSEYYAQYGGDYNITTTAGGIASTIMKLRAVLPNAEIILGTPVSGLGPQQYQPYPVLGENKEAGKWISAYMLALRNLVVRTADELSVHCVDVYGTCGINGLNRAKYISDNIHQTPAGQKMLARGVIGGLKTFQTVFDQKSDWTDKQIMEFNFPEEKNAFYSYEHIQTTFTGANSADGIVLKLNRIAYAAGAPTWIPNSKADAAWAASSFYTTPDKANNALGNYNGDYDLSTTAGQIASMIMKLQTICPNTVIVFDLSGIEQAELREVIVLTAAKLSIPCIETDKASSVEESLKYIIPNF